MNRKERRAAAVNARRGAQKAAKAAEDVQTTKALVNAQLLQDDIHAAVKRSLGDKPATVEDLKVIIHCLGMTAAGLACQVGASESEFIGKMSIYIKQVRKALGLPDEEPEAEGPSLVLP